MLTYTHKDRIYQLWYAANCLPVHYGIVNCIEVCRNRNEILFELLHKLTSERATQKGSHEDKARCVMGIVTDSARDLFIYMYVKDKKQFVLTHCIFLKLPSALLYYNSRYVQTILMLTCTTLALGEDNIYL